MKISSLVLASAAAGLSTPAMAAVGLSLFDSGYVAPVFVAGRANNLFVVEQGGRIVQVNRSTRARTTFFTVPNLATGGEKGLLGFAFDPSYTRNGRFFVNVTSRVNGQLVSEIRRYTNPAIATEAASVVLRVNQPFDNHKAGWIGFGADRNLYVAFGDGGSANDPQNNAQNKASLLGKILRIDINRDAYPADADRNYAIPSTNPFGNEVYAYGLRNPYRASFDRTTGDLWIGDVGQGRTEEINRIAAGTSGQNFGWRPLEGVLPTPGVNDPIPPGTTAPVFGYDHLGRGKSVTGGNVFRGFGVDDLAGRYVFGDFITGQLWSIGLDGSGLRDFTGAATPFGRANWSSFGEDGNRNLYSVDYNGRIFRVVAAPSLAAARGLAVDATSGAPDPAQWSLMITGFAAIGAAQRRRRAAAAGKPHTAVAPTARSAPPAAGTAPNAAPG